MSSIESHVLYSGTAREGADQAPEPDVKTMRNGRIPEPWEQPVLAEAILQARAREAAILNGAGKRVA